MRNTQWAIFKGINPLHLKYPLSSFHTKLFVKICVIRAKQKHIYDIR